MLRGILAVITGWVMFGFSQKMFLSLLLSGRRPQTHFGLGFMVFSLVFGICFAVLSGYAVAVLTGRADLRYVFVLAGLIAGMALVSLVVIPGYGARTSQIVVLLIMVPALLLGGLLRVREAQQVDVASSLAV